MKGNTHQVTAEAQAAFKDEQDIILSTSRGTASGFFKPDQIPKVIETRNKVRALKNLRAVSAIKIQELYKSIRLDVQKDRAYHSMSINSVHLLTAS